MRTWGPCSSAVRTRPERGPLRLRADAGSPVVGAGGPEGQTPQLTRSHGGTQATDIQAQEAGAPHPLQGRAADAAAVPAVRRPQAAAPRLPDVRLLRGQASHRGRGRLT